MRKARRESRTINRSMLNFSVESGGQKRDTGIRTMSTIAYLSLGSNVGDRVAQLREAQRRLAEVGRVVATSAVYETEPVEFTDQPWFLNSAVALETAKTPHELMTEILKIEEQMGRRRLQKKGPRTIDIDILLFGDEVIDSPELTIPHPAMSERRFVLEPLAEIAPEAQHPVMKRTIQELRSALPRGQTVRRTGFATTDD